MSEKDRLEQVCKMAELGLMSASMMHELRQPLWAVKANMQLLMVGGSEGDRSRYLTQMSDSIEAMERLISTVVDFARSPEESLGLLDVNAPLGAALNMLSYKMPRARVVVHAHLSEGLPLVRGSHQGLLQVFINLLQNSLDAMEAVRERHLWAITRQGPGGTVEVLIGDSGEGIPAEVAEQVFEYFFTTKPRGKGTGLGLAISLEIARSHGGALELVSAEERQGLSLNGGGPTPATLFRLRLPEADRAEAGLAKRAAPVPEP